MKTTGRQGLIIPDCHIDAEHKRAYELMLKAAKTLNGGRGPAFIYLLGDYGDFISVTGHQRRAFEERFLYKEAAAINARLDQLDRLWPRADKTYIEGNHEWRLARYIDAKAPELAKAMELETLLRLDRRARWTFVPYGPTQLVQVAGSRLWARHEPLTGGALPAHGTVIKAGCSIIYGHTHTAQSSQVVMANGDTHIGISVGWLGDARKPAFAYVRGHHQWSLGFGVVTVAQGGDFFVETARIINNRVLVNGRIVSG